VRDRIAAAERLAKETVKPKPGGHDATWHGKPTDEEAEAALERKGI
jgi:hypothetical protein